MLQGRSSACRDSSIAYHVQYVAGLCFFAIKGRYLADSYYNMPLGRFLDIGISQICPRAKMAVINDLCG